VIHAELLEPCQPLIEVGAGIDFEPHVVEPGTPRVEGLALIPVMLLELDDGASRRMQEQNAAPLVAGAE
jgi:hypothetical protein